MQTRNYQQPSQQQGFVLALALLLMLFIGVIVISSAQRTGTETRVAQSEAHIATLQAAAEAALRQMQAQVHKCTMSSLEDAYSCLEDDHFINDTKLSSFLNFTDKGQGEGTKTNKFVFNTDPLVHAWLENKESNKVQQLQQLSPCLGSELGNSCLVRVFAHAQQETDGHVIAQIVAASVIEFKLKDPGPGSGLVSDTPLNALFDLLEDEDNVVFLDNPPTTRGRNQSNTIGGTKISDLNEDNYKPKKSDMAKSIIDEVLNMEPGSLGLPVIEIDSNTNPTYGMNQLTSAAVMVVTGTGDVTFDQSSNYPVILIRQDQGSIKINTRGQNSFNGIIIAPNADVESVQGTPKLGVSIVAANLHLAQSTDIDGFNPNDLGASNQNESPPSPSPVTSISYQTLDFEF